MCKESWLSVDKLNNAIWMTVQMLKLQWNLFLVNYILFSFILEQKLQETKLIVSSLLSLTFGFTYFKIMHPKEKDVSFNNKLENLSAPQTQQINITRNCFTRFCSAISKWNNTLIMY